MTYSERARAIDAADHDLASEYRRLNPLGPITVRQPSMHDLNATLLWLRAEQDATGHSFYANRNVIVNARQEGNAFVAHVAGRCVGLLVDDGTGPDIVTTHPDYRRQGIGRALLAYSIARARQLGRNYLEACCVTDAGEALCRAMGYRATFQNPYGPGVHFALPISPESPHMTFIDFVRTRHATDTPRGDFIRDTRMLIECNKLPHVETWDALHWAMVRRNACAKAIDQAGKLWREYERAKQKGRA